MLYGRTTLGTGKFGIPDDFLAWHPTTHHKGDLKGLYEKLVSANYPIMQLFYVWGHSIEFERDKNWHVLEEFCKLASCNKDIWYATNIEIYDYICALKSVKFGIDYRTAYNPSCLSVWITIDDTPIEIKPGENDLLWRV